MSIRMRVEATAATHVGGRRRNEDALAVCDPERVGTGWWWGVVCDGIGGHANGDRAARIAAETFAVHLDHESGGAGPDDHVSALADAATLANNAVWQAGQGPRGPNGMGTTFVALVLDAVAGRAAVAHAGDSRAYLHRGGQLVQLTIDHNVGMDRRHRGIPDDGQPEELLSRHLGVPPEFFAPVEVVPFEVEPGDVLLLCTDGVYDAISNLEKLATRLDPAYTDPAAALVNLATRAGNPDPHCDNCTAVVLRVGESVAV